jgi:hypothetical protein
VHKAQGLTVEKAYVLATESLTKEAGYVALSRARECSELFVPLDGGADEIGHDPKQRSNDPGADLARRLSTSHAKQLATAELEGGMSKQGRERTDAVPSVIHAGSFPPAPERQDGQRVYGQAQQIELGSGTNSDEPTTDEAQGLRRYRSLNDAIKLANEAHARVDAERDLGPSQTRPERDRSWGLSR